MGTQRRRVISFQRMMLLDRFSAHLSSLGLESKRALVAVSGGPDSVVLLDLLARSRHHHQHELIVAHVDHGIHPESARIAERVRLLAGSYQLPMEAGQLCLGLSATETVARERRYAWLESLRVRSGATFIFTAHHADDQVETVLMRVLGGSGPAGLAGMASRHGSLVRPLLPFRRAELREHLRTSGLEAWLDPANADPRHLRSWIRTDLLPLLRSRLPEVETNLGRVVYQAASDRAAWDAVLDTLPGFDLQLEPGGISVAASPLGKYDSSLTQAAILALARRAGCPLGPTRAARVLGLLHGSSSGSRVPLGAGWAAELAFGRLRIFQADRAGAPMPWSLQGSHGAGAWADWQFQWQRAIAPERQDRSGLRAWFSIAHLTVRSWVPGEKLRPLGGTGRRLIVRCFQDVRVPRSRRSSWPILAHGEDVLWVPGVCRSDTEVPLAGTESLRVDAHYA